MASSEMTQLRFETAFVCGLLLSYGMGVVDEELTVVLLLFMIAVMLSMLKYRYQRDKT